VEHTPAHLSIIMCKPCFFIPIYTYLLFIGNIIKSDVNVVLMFNNIFIFYDF